MIHRIDEQRRPAQEITEAVGRKCRGHHINQRIHRLKEHCFKTAGAHVVGHNADSIGIAYVGGTDINGKPLDTRTDAQKKALKDLILKLQCDYPNATVHGHRDFAATACPSFNVATEL